MKKRNMTSIVESADVKCPFWKGFGKDGSIRCEGCTKSSEIRIRFRRREQLRSFALGHCMSEFRACRLCAMLFAKYEER